MSNRFPTTAINAGSKQRSEEIHKQNQSTFLLLKEAKVEILEFVQTIGKHQMNFVPQSN